MSCDARSAPRLAGVTAVLGARWHAFCIALDMSFEQRGVPASAAMRECGIELTVQGGPEDRVPGSQVERLWTFAVQRTGDPIVGLHMAESYSQGALDILR